MSDWVSGQSSVERYVFEERDLGIAGLKILDVFEARPVRAFQRISGDLRNEGEMALKEQKEIDGDPERTDSNTAPVGKH